MVAHRYGPGLSFNPVPPLPIFASYATVWLITRPWPRGGFAVSGVRTGVAPLFHPATDGFAVSRVRTGDLAI